MGCNSELVGTYSRLMKMAKTLSPFLVDFDGRVRLSLAEGVHSGGHVPSALRPIRRSPLTVALLTHAIKSLLKGERTMNPPHHVDTDICSDCPPPNYPTEETRCTECPRRAADGN